MPKIFNKLPKSFFLIPVVLVTLSSIGIAWQLSRSPAPDTNFSQPAPKIDDPQLKNLAHSKTPSLQRSRARYILAVNLLKKYQGGQALQELNNLEKDYPLLEPYILLKRARAYQLTNDSKSAKEIWEKVAKTYKNSPYEAEALYKLSAIEPKYGEQAIKQYPYYPLVWDIINEKLKQNPNQPNLLKILVKYDPDVSVEVRDVLVKNYAAQLTGEDWQNIAKGYLQQPDYQKAAIAYSKAPKTATNLYHLARSLQLMEKKEAAKPIYLQIVKNFPKAEETPLALQRLAQISKKEEAIGYLDTILKNYPLQSAEALGNKAEILEKMGNKKAATQAYQILLKKYPQAPETADYRWKTAYQLAQKGDLKNAYSWATSIITSSSELPVAAKASFWIGKWSKQLGKNPEQAFKQTITKYPQSYYAWRSAVNLGANVGDFNNVGHKKVTVENPSQDPQPTAGSDLFKELCRLEQWKDAYRLFQGEMHGKDSLDVNETFTNSLLESKIGQFPQAIHTIFGLKERDGIKDQQEWQSLRENSDYWYTLFPFPYQEIIVKNAQAHNLNPLLVVALMRQESGFQPEVKSPVGAIGLMQVMPNTAKWVANKIQLPHYDLIKPQDNINLGTWYLNHTHQEYQNDSMLAVASYNAGPSNVTRWIKQYGLKDQDAFVENIPYDETKNYVESVFGNYWNYLRLYNREVAQWIKTKTK